MKNYNETIKKIRLDKGYSQKYISNNICTQGNYSKLENTVHEDIKCTVFHLILNKLEMSYEEFLFVHNDFKLTTRDQIIKSFFAQQYNDLNALEELKEECIDFLIKHPEDYFVEDIYNTLKALQIVGETNQFEEAQEIVKHIWSKLSLRDNLYISDILLLNNILFIFPLETAVGIRDFTFRQIQKYKNFYNINRLKINFNLNLSLMYMKISEYEESLKIIENTIPLCKKEETLILLSVCYMRKGNCLSQITGTDEGFVQKGRLILELLEEWDVLNRLNNEVHRYSLKP